MCIVSTSTNLRSSTLGVCVSAVSAISVIRSFAIRDICNSAPEQKRNHTLGHVSDVISDDTKKKASLKTFVQVSGAQEQMQEK